MLSKKKTPMSFMDGVQGKYTKREKPPTLQSTFNLTKKVCLYLSFERVFRILRLLSINYYCNK